MKRKPYSSLTKRRLAVWFGGMAFALVLTVSVPGAFELSESKEGRDLTTVPLALPPVTALFYVEEPYSASLRSY